MQFFLTGQMAIVLDTAFVFTARLQKKDDLQLIPTFDVTGIAALTVTVSRTWFENKCLCSREKFILLFP
jgi:hypothetical protein